MQKNDEFLEKLVKLVSEKEMTTREIYESFPTVNSNTVSWYIHKASSRGLIEKAAKGKYRARKDLNYSGESKSSLDSFATSVFEYLSSNGFKFYFSGLHALASLVQIKEMLPIIICTNADNVSNIQMALMREFDFAITDTTTGINKIKNNIRFYILSSSNFELAEKNIACKEKAFVDLYYACNYMNYPVSQKELVSLLKILEPNAYKFRRSSKDRNISDELNFLVSYNRQFIKELAVII